MLFAGVEVSLGVVERFGVGVPAAEVVIEGDDAFGGFCLVVVRGGVVAVVALTFILASGWVSIRGS